MKKLIVFIVIVLTIMLLSGCEWLAGRMPALLDDPGEAVEEPEPAVPEPANPEPAEPTEPETPEAPDQSAWEQRLATWPMAFGFADSGGRRLIYVTDEYEAMEEDGFDPAMYTMTIGPYGEIATVAYENVQEESDQNTWRDSMENFNNLPGFLYSPADTRFTKNKTYVLASMGPLMDALIALSPPGWKGNTPPMAEETIESIAAYKGRGVEWGKVLANTKKDEGLIGLVLFERQGNDMLFSIVYMDETKTLFWDCPAEYDEVSTWRVDTGDGPGLLEPLLLARFEEGLLLMLTWGSAEGESILLLCEEDGAFIETQEVSYGRYWSPF